MCSFHLPLASFVVCDYIMKYKHVPFLGVELCFELYNPRIHEIQVVKLEKRLDDSLLYLRDALPEFSTFDVNMKPVPHESSQEVPVNKVHHAHVLRCQFEEAPCRKLRETCVCVSPAQVLFLFSLAPS